MRSFEQRKLQTRLIIIKNRLLRPRFLVKVFLTLMAIFIATPFIIYSIVYSGYSRKIISSTDEIKDELSTGVLITDSSKDNLDPLINGVKDAFQKRKINSLYIYLIGDTKNISDENLLAMLDKIPVISIKIDRTAETPQQICESAKDVYTLSKFITLSYKDAAIRTSFICNNRGIFTQSYVPSVNETDLKVTQSGLTDYFKDIAKVFLGVELAI